MTGRIYNTKEEQRRARRMAYRRWAAKKQAAVRAQDGSVMFPNGRAQDVPNSVLIEREKRAAAPRDLTASVFGDPPPGFSALDMKRRGIAP